MRDLGVISSSLPRVRDYLLEPVSIGNAATSVYRLTSPGKASFFLKVSPVEDASELNMERNCLGWLASRAPVPTVLDFGIEGKSAYLLIEALDGCNGTEAPATLWPRIVAQLALQLRLLHTLDPEECPFDRSLDRVLPLARLRARSGQVDESNFDAERLGSSAVQLLDSLDGQRPRSEDIVVAHGDAGLSNVIFLNDSFSGFVDCGRCGRADRHQDLALAHRSIESRFGSRLAGEFLRAYGSEHVDVRKLSYYRLLDEFF